MDGPVDWQNAGAASDSGATTDSQRMEAADPNELDENEFDSIDFDMESMGDGLIGSVASTIYRHSYANGRRYHKYRYGTYPLPNDETEQNREHLKHALFLELTGGKYFFAPIGDEPQKIIDLGTGVGNWAIEVALKFPGARVVGTDLSPIQPDWVPPNVEFIIDDLMDLWLQGPGWDLIHFRQVLLLVPNVNFVLQQCFENVRPGGWIEIQEFGGKIKCDDGTTPGDSAFSRYFQLTTAALGKKGSRWDIANCMDEYLTRAGFINVQSKRFKVPVGAWAKNKKLRLVGMYMKDQLEELVDALGPMVFPVLGMSTNEIRDLVEDVQVELRNSSYHSYIDYLFWYGQRPPISADNKE